MALMIIMPSTGGVETTITVNRFLSFPMHYEHPNNTKYLYFRIPIYMQNAIAQINHGIEVSTT